jgi:hypothetical protein
MLIVVTVNARQFPIAAITRIVVVIVVLVMHREQLQIRIGKFECAPPTDPRKYLERVLAMSFLPELPIAPGLGSDLPSLSLPGRYGLEARSDAICTGKKFP